MALTAVILSGLTFGCSACSWIVQVASIRLGYPLAFLLTLEVLVMQPF